MTGRTTLIGRAASRLTWDVVLVHPDPHRYTGTSELHATGDTLDLTRFHDVVCAEAEAHGALGDTDHLGVRKARALGVIADAQARLDLMTLVHAPDPEVHERARRDAVDGRDVKVRLYLHASLADVVAGDAGATGSAEAVGPVTLDLIREWAGGPASLSSRSFTSRPTTAGRSTGTTRPREWLRRCVCATRRVSSRVRT